mgnify:CR=1 FL=1
MSYGLQISASGIMTSLYRQDVYANNLANIDTVGFKPDVPSSRPRDAVRAEDSLPFLPSNKLLERLGAGAMLNPNSIDFTQGSLKTTGNALDLAIQGDGFFVVGDATGRSGEQVRLTRDGRFTRDSGGRLVMATTGAPVLDTAGLPIELRSGSSITVDGDGTIRQSGEVMAQIKIAQVENRGQLSKLGQSLFMAPAAAIGAAAASGSVRQFAVEDSSADEIKTLMQMTSAGREVEANVSLIQQHDRMMDRAINTLGRVA